MGIWRYQFHGNVIPANQSVPAAAGYLLPENQNQRSNLARRQEAQMLNGIATTILSRGLPAICGLLLAGTLSAATITFSEVPASNENPVYLTNEYAGLGLTFVNNNGNVWGGNSNGDPGNWGLEGTNTAPFLGFNGAGPTGDGYSASLVFSAPISAFSLDVAQGNGTFGTETFTIDAFDSASNLLSSETVPLTTVDSWLTLTVGLAGISRIDISGAGSDFFSFGIDNLHWTSGSPAIPEPSTWALMASSLFVFGLRLRRK